MHISVITFMLARTFESFAKIGCTSWPIDIIGISSQSIQFKRVVFFQELSHLTADYE